MTTITVDSNGQIELPSKIRQKLNIKRGMKLNIEVKGDEIILKPIKSEYFDNMSGILQTNGELSKELLDERAKNKITEDK